MLLARDKSQLLIVDVQEKLLSVASKLRRGKFKGTTSTPPMATKMLLGSS
jgi:hypothetical protein